MAVECGKGFYPCLVLYLGLGLTERQGLSKCWPKSEPALLFLAWAHDPPVMPRGMSCQGSNVCTAHPSLWSVYNDAQLYYYQYIIMPRQILQYLLICVANLLFWLPFCILSLPGAFSLLTLGMGWSSTCGHQAWPRGHGWNPCAANLVFWPPFSVTQQLELFFQGSEQTGWWSSSPHYIMFLRTSTLQREEKKCLFSRPILLGRQTASALVCTEACCSYLLREPSPKPPCHGHSLCSSWKWPLWWDSLECPFSRLTISEGWKSVIFQDCCSVVRNFILNVALNKWLLTQATQWGTKALSSSWKPANKCDADQMSSTSCHIFEKRHKVKYSFFGKGRSQLGGAKGIHKALEISTHPFL